MVNQGRALRAVARSALLADTRQCELFLKENFVFCEREVDEPAGGGERKGSKLDIDSCVATGVFT